MSHKLTLNQVLGNGGQAVNNYFGNNYEQEQYFTPQYTQPTRAPVYQPQNRPQVTESIPSKVQTSSNLQCGIRKAPNSTPLIVGGISAGRAEFPWLVAQHFRSKFTCGGSLVSNRVVISAGHCFHDISSDQTTYYIGKHDITKLNEDGFVTSEVDRFVIHPNYDPQSYDSDIGAAILTKQIIYSSTIQPICIWTQSQGYSDIVSQKGIVAGTKSFAKV